MNEFLHRAAVMLGLRQQAYKTAFAEGGPAHLALVDLANYSHAFNTDTDGLSTEQIMRMAGRRDAFFRIFNHLKLTPNELEDVYRWAVLRAADRQQQHGVEE